MAVPSAARRRGAGSRCKQVSSLERCEVAPDYYCNLCHNAEQLRPMPYVPYVVESRNKASACSRVSAQRRYSYEYTWVAD
eukprot:scaffold154266_cov18-Prasinocladus_malaysianus.AAC.1